MIFNIVEDLFRFYYNTLSRAKVFVNANPHPASNALLIIADVVVGGALARPKGFSKRTPTTSTLRSTASIGVQYCGSWGVTGTDTPCNDCNRYCY